MDRLPMLKDIFESAKVATTPTIAIVSTQQKTERNNDSMDTVHIFVFILMLYSRPCPSHTELFDEKASYGQHLNYATEVPKIF